MIATIPVGDQPEGVAVSPDGKTVYVANELGNSVSVIDTATNAVTSTIAGNILDNIAAFGIAVAPDGSQFF